MLRATAGSILVNAALPQDLRDYSRTLDKASTAALLRGIAEKYPERYREISHRLLRAGQLVSHATGAFSFGPEHLRRAPSAERIAQQLREELDALLDDDSLDGPELDTKVLQLVSRWMDAMRDEVFQESAKENNPLVDQVTGASRGNKLNLSSLRGADLLYVDHRDRPIPFPVLRSYSQGLRPSEYWAGSYGARKGVVDVKMCLAAGTLVLMADGSSRAIEEIRPGDRVVGSDGEGRVSVCRVTSVFANGRRPCVEYRFRIANRTFLRSSELHVTATPEHRVLAWDTRERVFRQVELRELAGQKELQAVLPRGGLDDGTPAEEALLWGAFLPHADLQNEACVLRGVSRPILDLLDERLRPLGFKLVLRADGAGVLVAELARGDTLERLEKLRSLLAVPCPSRQLPDELWSWDAASVGRFVGAAIGVHPNRRIFMLRTRSKPLALGLIRLLGMRFGYWPSLGFDGGSAWAGKDRYVEIRGRYTGLPEAVCSFGPAQEILQEQRVLPEPGTFAGRLVLLYQQSAGERETYDLEVDHPHHLFVLASGLISSNSTRDAGYLGKVLNQVVHRQIVTDIDGPEEDEGHKTAEGEALPRGLPVDTDDPDNEGALLAQPAGGYPRNTVLTARVLSDLRDKGIRRILVRSPAVGGPADGGVYARDVGVREYGRLPVRGEQVSMAAAQALAEPLSQGALSSKHSGGVAAAAANAAVSGFERIEQLIQIPKTFKGGATHAEHDGVVTAIEDAPGGGKYVWIDGRHRHYVARGLNVTVAKGERVEAGDTLSEGLPNPAAVVAHKGIGEGRRYFATLLRQAYRDAGLKAHRRNAELLAKGLIDHVRMQQDVGHWLAEDVVPYRQVEHQWEPRPGWRWAKPEEALGKYLERPVLHYTLGTKVRPSVLRQLQEFGVRRVAVHDEPAPFQAEMVRGAANLQYDEDWLTRMYGAGLKRSLLEAAHRGAVSDPTGTSFVPALAYPEELGLSGKVVVPKRP